MQTKFNGDIKRNFTTLKSHDNKLTFKEIIAKYGKIGIGFYVGLSCTTFTLISISLFNGLDVESLLEKIPFISREKKVEKNEENPRTLESIGATLAIAFALNKLLTPFKMAITVFSTPYIAKYLKRLKK